MTAWERPGVLVLGRSEVEKLLTMREALRAVELSFKFEAEGEVVMPPKLYLDLPRYHGDFRAMPAYVNGVAGIKWVSVFPNNPNHNLPSVMASIVLSDPSTGRALAFMDGTYITSMRTGAAGGVAVQYLARKKLHCHRYGRRWNPSQNTTDGHSRSAIEDRRGKSI
jgi:alanine dehydrogenase